MPTYIFENPETGEYIEVVQKMNAFHIYIDYDGLEWRRVWHCPNASIDTDFSADMSESEFVRKTENKGGTMGDLWDASAELSSKREQKYGKDKVKDKYFLTNFFFILILILIQLTTFFSKKKTQLLINKIRFREKSVKSSKSLKISQKFENIAKI